MPMFEYRCGACGRDFEELVLSASAEKSVKCPTCGVGDIQRKMSCFSGITGSPGPGEAVPAPPNCGYS